MYRDDPLDDELELRAIIGDGAVDRLAASQPHGTGGAESSARDAVEAAADVLRVLQGWVDDDAAGRWFRQPQQRLDGQTPVDALTAGVFEEVEDAARAWAAAHG